MFELEPDSNESRLNPYRFQPNLWDAEHPEWFIYDVELLNAWYWDEFIIEWDENEDRY